MHTTGKTFWVFHRDHDEPTLVNVGAEQSAQRDIALKYVRDWNACIDLIARDLSRPFKIGPKRLPNTRLLPFGKPASITNQHQAPFNGKIGFG